MYFSCFRYHGTVRFVLRTGAEVYPAGNMTLFLNHITLISKTNTITMSRQLRDAASTTSFQMDE